MENEKRLKCPFGDLMASGLEALSLPACVLEGGGSESLLLLAAFALLRPEIIPEKYFLNKRILKRGFSRRPLGKFNPLGVLLTERLLQNRKKTIREASQMGLREALSLPGTYTDSYRNLIRPLLDAALVIYQKHSVELTGNNIIREALRDRFLELRRHLQANEVIFTADAELMLKSARESVTAEYTERKLGGRYGKERVTPLFHPGRAKKAVRLKPRTLADKLAALGGTSIKYVQSALRLADLGENTSDDEEEQEFPPDLAATKQASRLIGGSGLQKQAPFYPCGLSPAGGLGEAVMSLVLTKTAELQTNEDVLLAMIFFGLMPPEQLLTCRVTRGRDECGRERFIARSKVRPHQKAPRMPQFYVKSGSEFARPIPGKLVVLFLKLRRLRDRDKFKCAFDGMAARLVQIHPDVTLAKMMRGLTVQGEAFFGIPNCVAEVGFYPLREKAPAYVSYTSLPPSIVTRILHLQRVLDVTLSHGQLNWATTGSRICPRLAFMQKFFKGVKRFFRPLKTRSLERAVVHWNIVAAGLHMICLLILGIRNNPMEGLPVDIAHGISDWDIIQQKGEMHAIFVPPFLQRLLHLIRNEIWIPLERRIAEEGLSVDEDGSFSYCYGFIDFKTLHSGAVSLAWTPPRHRKIVEGLLCSRFLSQFSKLDRKALRHFSNSQLREAGFPELQVRHFHNHHSPMLHANRRHRKEPMIARNVLAPMQEHLARLIGVL